MKEVQLRRLLRPIDETNRPDLQVLSVYREHGVVPKASRSDNFNKTPEDVSRYLHVRPGNLVVNKMKAWSGSVAVSPFEGIVSGDYMVCAVDPMLEPRYLHFLLRSQRFVGEMQMRSLGIRPNQERLYWGDLAEIRIPLPPPDDQRSIADFLDARVASVDRIIAARRHQVQESRELSEARLQELFEELARRHNSARLGYLICGLEQGWSPQAEAVEAGEREWGVVRAGCVNDGVFRPDDNKRLPDGLEPQRHYELRPGDLLMSRASGSLDKIGSVAVVPDGVRPRLLLCDKIYRMKLGRGWLAAFIAPMLRARSNRELIRLGVSGAEGMANNLPSGVVRSLRIPLAPEPAQRAAAIATHVIDENLGSLIQASEDSVRLLTEYKQSLITAAVNGELDLTTAGNGMGTRAP